jgi:hypothetical protein
MIVDEMTAEHKKIKWKKSGRLGLRAYQDDQFLGLNHDDMNPISQWCLTNNCGRRMSFDTFQFRDEKEISMFLLKWS